MLINETSVILEMATTVSPNIKCQLSQWGLPPLIVSWFRKKGITSLFEWQVECLCKNDVLFGGNLIYSAPTSAGKTLVADFLLLKRVLEYNKKALVIEPFVALTREKAATLKSMLFTTKARVGAFGGTYYTPGGMAAVSVAVCTIEKANNFINKLINEDKLGDLGIIVVDEIHYLGDERRGHQLELLLTKVLYYNSQRDVNRRIQIVGLSATIPNLKSIAGWLQATLYVTDYRPIPLVEKIKLGNKIYEVNSYIRDSECQPLEVIDPLKYSFEKDYDDLFYLCMETIINGHSALIFCESKRECEIMAATLASQILILGNRLNSENPDHKTISEKLRQILSPVKIKDVLFKLKKCPAGPDTELIKAIKFGVAFHHAGLTSEEREIIEDGFKGGCIKALMATSTLSSGVNLPARKVIIKSPTMISSNSVVFQKEMLNPTSYRQMIGRAGRKGIDTCGESVLICRPDNQDIAIKLINSSLGNINSSLSHRMIASEGEPSGLKKAVLEVIANGTAVTRVNLNRYLLSTFWLSTSDKKLEENFESAITKTLRFLVTHKFIEELKPGLYKPTRLGNAVLASGIQPDESLELLQDLIKARQGFCLLNDLHIIYQVTPNDIARTIDLRDWQHYSKIWNNLDETCQIVGQRVGVDETVIARRAQGYSSSLIEEKERVYRRFWIALVINDLVSEMQLVEICRKYRISKATVQQAQRAVAQYAGVISLFCQELGYANIAALVTPLESRVNFSCQRDLLDLIRLNITRPVARCLFDAGYTNIIAVAKAEKLDIEFNIRQLQPFKKEQSFSEKDTPFMWVPELAKNMTTLEYASHIVDTALNYVEIEYELDLTPAINKKREDEARASQSASDREDRPSPAKRGRIDNGSNEIVDTVNEEGDLMVRPRDVPNFVVHYVGQNVQEINKFMDNWILHSAISINFKLEKELNEAIGANMKTKRRRSQGSRKKTNNTQARLDDEADLSGCPSDDGVESSQSLSQDGLPLRLEIDRIKHRVKKMFVCFDDDLTVHIIDKHEAFVQIRDNLANYLKDSYASATSRTATQRREAFTPIKLFTQDIVLTYKVLYAAFNIDQVTLNRHFEWNSFDVAWWLVNNCPNRGLNNINSSLSLVAKTKWASGYHHFLHPSSKRQAGRSCLVPASDGSGRTTEEFNRLKDIVKAGKTAILQPLINEILSHLKMRRQIEAYQDAEIASRLTMAQMMVHGIGLNMKTLKDELTLYDDLSQQLTDIAQKYYAKSNISLTNNKHVARILYEDLDLKRHLLNHGTISDISKDPTNSEILKILAEYHPFPKLIRDFRKIGKAIEALQSVNTYARYNSELGMMRVFGQCDFWQLTGRVSMFDPDLFLINRNFSVTIPAHGNRDSETVECVPRGCFVPVSGWTFIAADYSQLELRLLAHFANDQNLLDILNRSLHSDDTFDVFKTVAAKVYRTTIDQVTSENRQHAKQICYGIIYGMGNRSLANQLGVDYERAEEFRQDFFNAFPRIKIYTEELIEECERLGYVESLLGRRRCIDGINSDNSSARSRAQRVAVNTRIQSSASDLIKLAMKLVNQKILEHFSNNTRLVLEMHDELIYEVNPDVLSRFGRTLKFTMESLTSLEDLRVKLQVNLKKGNDWSSMEGFNIDT